VRHKIRCSDCFFWQQVTSGEGECRRNSPRVGIPGSVSNADGSIFEVVVRWPVTAGREWCGEAEPRVAPASAPLVEDVCE
jgi:hypothetical protein